MLPHTICWRFPPGELASLACRLTKYQLNIVSNWSCFLSHRNWPIIYNTCPSFVFVSIKNSSKTSSVKSFNINTVFLRLIPAHSLNQTANLKFRTTTLFVYVQDCNGTPIIWIVTVNFLGWIQQQFMHENILDSLPGLHKSQFLMECKLCRFKLCYRKRATRFIDVKF